MDAFVKYLNNVNWFVLVGISTIAGVIALIILAAACYLFSYPIVWLLMLLS